MGPLLSLLTLQGPRKSRLEQLDAAGIRRVVVVDLTDPSVNLPVVRVVIPGLEGPDKHPNYCAGKRAKAGSGN
jgi:ribosomal protein S12 methylthiotransferase accessory factor